MNNCIFCKIISGEIPSTIVYEDDQMLCFKDVDPQALVHVLIIPKKHIESIDSISTDDLEILSHIMLKIGEIAKNLGLKNGYRIVSNIGEDGLQSVKHLHFHLLGGERLGWPPC